jgi:hypothetical protein
MSLDLESPIMNMQIQINNIFCNVILSVIELELKDITKKKSTRIWLCMLIVDCFTTSVKFVSLVWEKNVSGLLMSYHQWWCIYVGWIYYSMNINMMVTGNHLPSLVHFSDFIKKLEEVPFLSWNMVRFLVSNTVCSN